MSDRAQTTSPARTDPPCGYCGAALTSDREPPERFGERFCSEAHAAEFVTGVRAARIQAAAREQPSASGELRSLREDGPSDLPARDQRPWLDSVKRSACWGAPLLLLAALPLLASGGWAAAGGSLLSAAALLACPIGMFFMMRAMISPGQQGRSRPERDGENRGA